MAEVHILTPRNCSVGQAARMLTDLQSLRNHGLDLGTRAPHIRATGDVLQQMADQLANRISILSQTLNRLGPPGLRVMEDLYTYLEHVQSLANTAQCFPNGP